jgi:hypothetical protein
MSFFKIIIGDVSVFHRLQEYSKETNVKYNDFPRMDHMYSPPSVSLLRRFFFEGGL